MKGNVDRRLVADDAVAGQDAVEGTPPLGLLDDREEADLPEVDAEDWHAGVASRRSQDGPITAEDEQEVCGLAVLERDLVEHGDAALVEVAGYLGGRGHRLSFAAVRNDAHCTHLGSPKAHREIASRRIRHVRPAPEAGRMRFYAAPAERTRRPIRPRNHHREDERCTWPRLAD